MSEVIRRAIIDSKLTFKHIERETGVTRQSIMGFVQRKRTIRLDMADKLAHFLGLELKKTKQR